MIDFKKIVCNWFDCCKEPKQDLATCITALTQSKKDLETLIEDKKTLINELNIVSNENNTLIEELNLCRQAYSNPTKIPQKNIGYLRNVYLGDKIGFKTQSIPVKLFITMQDEKIAQELRARKLLFDPTMTDEEKDVLGKKILDVAKTGAIYTKDSFYGFSPENWLFPFEYRIALKFGVGGECDTHGINQTTHMRISGWPADKIFASAGSTRSGFGHLTVYPWSFVLKDWVHSNSTTFRVNKKSLADFPLKDDETDSIGIHPDRFWFSFNDVISIQRFDTLQAKEFFDKEEAMKRIVISQI